jgi:nucleoside-diphosphate-sugar epimerase
MELSVFSILAFSVLKAVFHILSSPRPSRHELPRLPWKSSNKDKLRISAERNVKSVAVTGGSGFLGSYLVDLLISRDYRVVILDISPPKTQHSGVLFEKVDISNSTDSNVARIAAVLSSVDLVLHCAALIELQPYHASATYNVNAVGTGVLLSASYIAGVTRFVGISSSSVYTVHGKSRLNVNESEPLPEIQCSAYSESKVRAERLILEANSASFRTVIVRIPTIYGFDDPLLMRTVAKGIPAFGESGKQSWMFVKNISHGLELVANKLASSPNEVAGEIFNLGEDEPMTIHEFIHLYYEIEGRGRKLGVVPYSVEYVLTVFSEALFNLTSGYFKSWTISRLCRPSLYHACNEYYLDWSKARQVLGFKPPYTRREAFQEISDAYKKRAS